MQSLIQKISTATGAVKLSIVVIICLIITKVIISITSCSISITAQAADSLLDIFSVSITFIAIKMSSAPADNEHPFGHGKAEGLAALVQAILVLGAGMFIIYSSVQRIKNGAEIRTDEGIAVMIVSIILSFVLSRHLHNVARATGSTAIDASAKNISADVYSAAGVLIGLIMVRITKIVIIDPIIALIMAAFVLKAGYDVTLRAIHELIDYALPEDEQAVIESCLSEHSDQIIEYHAMRSRRAGNERFVDLHLVLPRDMTFEDSHTMCDHIEQDIKNRLKKANVIIHAEPCNSEDCPKCSISDCEL
jgi:cation diffusion facilitator family transporter